jgi:Alpha amylase, catalytic domain
MTELTVNKKLVARRALVSKWPQFPTLYEINTWVWLSALSTIHGRRVDLGSVPSDEWDTVARLGFDGVWLMGVWERSPAGIAIANKNESLTESFRRTLPDFGPEDNVGSPYCIRRYSVDKHLGGPKGLATAREELSKRGLKLILDFVPNHVAPDHPWVSEHPEYFVRGTTEDLKNAPTSFLEVAKTICACGRDPYFPAWPDVLQLNAFDPGHRKAATDTLCSIAQQCDGVRCDMAMLLMNSVFERTWGSRAGQHPSRDYWVETIPAVKKLHPNFLFIAEAYWDLEWDLQQQGFDFCYDKRLYDRLEHEGAESVRPHLCADASFQRKLLRFLENHDEPRAAAAFSLEKELAAAVVTSTLPGARLFHEGQFEGRKSRLPVFLGRHPEEPVNQTLRLFYDKLLRAINIAPFRDGQWSLCERAGWPDNTSFQNLVAWSWHKGTERILIAVNLSSAPVQARVLVNWPDLVAGKCLLTDAWSGERYMRDGEELRSGLYVELGPWGFHFFNCGSQETHLGN